MNYKTKIVLMFAPFVFFFVGLAVLVNDMRHPVSANDECIVTATGSDVQKYRNQGRFIYRHSENVQHDVSLRCEQLGTVLLNDTQLFVTPVKSGQGAEVSRKRYHFLPERWMVSVNTGHESHKEK